MCICIYVYLYLCVSVLMCVSVFQCLKQLVQREMRRLQMLSCEAYSRHVQPHLNLTVDASNHTSLKVHSNYRCLSVCLSLSVCRPVCLCLSISLSLSLSLLSVSMYVYICIFVSVSPPVSVCLCLSSLCLSPLCLYLAVSVSVCLSACLSHGYRISQLLNIPYITYTIFITTNT